MIVRFLGYQVPYEIGMAHMNEAIANIDTIGPQLLLLEHEDVVTTTRQHGQSSIVTSEEELRRDGINLVETNRGGDVTFHGKGQLVGYPIVKLPPHVGALDYVRSLESKLAQVCTLLGIPKTNCVSGKTGVWIGDKKLIAIGIGISRGVTRHGFALNVTTNLERFTKHIVPCGLSDYGVTSLERELACTPNFEEVINILGSELRHLKNLSSNEIDI